MLAVFVVGAVFAVDETGLLVPPGVEAVDALNAKPPPDAPGAVVFPPN